MDKFIKIYIDEANDLLADLEKTLLELELHKGEKSLIEQVFRIMHTFKGNSKTFGFDKIGEFTHHLENIYDLVRADKIQLDAEIFNITLQSVDHIKNLLENKDFSDPQLITQHQEFLQKIDTIVSRINKIGVSLDNNKEPQSYVITENTITYHLFFKTDEDVYKTGIKLLYLLDELHDLGQCKAYPHMENMPDLNEMDAIKCYTYWDIFLATPADMNAIKDIFLFVEDQCELKISVLAEFNLMTFPEFVQNLEELFQNGEPIEINTINGLVKCLNQKIQQEKAKNNTTNQTTDQQKNKRDERKVIKVSSEKLDELMGLVSELVTTQIELSMGAQTLNNAKMTAIAENIEKISRRLRDNALNICLIPIEEIIIHFKRLVRDLNNEMNKDVVLLTEGTDTELDKRIIDNLRDPFMHILRNAMDHGIETAEERIKAGKPIRGTILLKAFYSGADVHIQIIDDGRGMDVKKIFDKAVAKGFINKDTQLSEKEIFDLVFLPGFSTAEKVTEVSGRGVGMDVVKRRIAEINGEVEIQSKLGIGTTVTIKLPLSLSIIDALLVRINDTHFLIPHSVVDKCEEATHEEIIHAVNNKLIFSGEPVPIINLRKEFDITDNVPEFERVIIINHENSKIGLVIDAVVGEHQAVLKPLGEIFKIQEIISGASILGNGEVALVIDTHKLIREFEKNNKISITQKNKSLLEII